MATYYFVQADEGGNNRRRFHNAKTCLFAATLEGVEVKRQVVNNRMWYDTCTCHACGGRLNQPAKVLDNNEAKTS